MVLARCASSVAEQVNSVETHPGTEKPQDVLDTEFTLLLFFELALIDAILRDLVGDAAPG